MIGAEKCCQFLDFATKFLVTKPILPVLSYTQKSFDNWTGLDDVRGEYEHLTLSSESLMDKDWRSS